jgi:hypothetical protein
VKRSRRMALYVGAIVELDNAHWRVGGVIWGRWVLEGIQSRERIECSTEQLAADPEFRVLNADVNEQDCEPPYYPTSGISQQAREKADRWARHLNEIIYGVPDGLSGIGCVTPRDGFGPETETEQRVLRKVKEIPAARSTIYDKLARYEIGDWMALVDARSLRPHRPLSDEDETYVAALYEVVADRADKSTVSRQTLRSKVVGLLDDRFGDGAVTVPPQSTFNRHVKLASKGTGIFGRAKTRQGNRTRSPTPYRRVETQRCGQVLEIDFTELDIMVFNPLMRRSDERVFIGCAFDVHPSFPRAIRVVWGKPSAMDSTLLLYDAVRPMAWRPGWPQELQYPYAGVPDEVMQILREGWQQPWLASLPLSRIEAVTVDRDSAFVSYRFVHACRLIGSDLILARVGKGSDKPHVERFFGSLKTMFLQHFESYTGGDLHSRGERPERGTVFFAQEVEEWIWQFVAREWLITPQTGLRLPGIDTASLSSQDIFQSSLASCGLTFLPPQPDLYLRLLPHQLKHIGDTGVGLHTMEYDGPLKDLRRKPSPYGGIASGRWPVHYDPNNLARAYIYDPWERRWIELKRRDSPNPDAPFTMAMYDFARTLVRDRGGDLSEGAPDVGRAVNELQADLRHEHKRLAPRRELGIWNDRAQRATKDAPQPGEPPPAETAIYESWWRKAADPANGPDLLDIFAGSDRSTTVRPVQSARRKKRRSPASAKKKRGAPSAITGRSAGRGAGGAADPPADRDAAAEPEFGW